MIANPLPKIRQQLGKCGHAFLTCAMLFCWVGSVAAQETPRPVSTARPELRVAGGNLDPYVPRHARPAAVEVPGDMMADSWPGVIPTLGITRMLSSEVEQAGYEELGSSSIVPISALNNTSEGEHIYPYDYELLPEEMWAGPPVPQPRREGAYQETTNQFDYMFKNGMGQMSYTTSSLFGIPAPTRESPLLIRPLFQVMWLDGPTATEMPPRLYEASVQLQWLKQINDRWGMAISITPGLYGDYEHIDWNTVRIPGYVGFKWNYSPTLAFAAGVVYYDRVDVGWVPIGGVQWTPTPNLNFDLIPPRPRAAWRCYWNGREEHWLYVAAEFGGGSWQIERNGNIEDQVAIRDYRIFFGHELKRNGWSLGRLEVGYVFGREIDYASSIPDYDLDSTFIIRSVHVR